MKARRPRRQTDGTDPRADRLHGEELARPHPAADAGDRGALGHLRQVFLRAARAWLRHDARRRAAPHPPVVAPGRRDHAHRDRRRAARVHLAPRRRRGRDRHHPQPQGDALQGRARQDLHASASTSRARASSPPATSRSSTASPASTRTTASARCRRTARSRWS